jgi:hypothetical protein
MKTLILLWILIFTIQVFAQDTKPEKLEAPYDVINLKFVIEGSPDPKDVGFDHPKSTWQFKYELRFLPEEKLLTEKSKYQPPVNEQIAPNETSAEKEKRFKKNNKEFDKAWKKLGILVVKGSISKTQLIEAKNREITIPIRLTPEILDILAKVSVTWDNPEFRLKTSGKISLKTSDNLKFKERFTPSWICPTKLIDQKENKHFWMINTCGAATEIKREDGKIMFGLKSKIQ